MKKLWEWLHSRDLFTWIGHGVVGFVLTFLFGWLFTAGAFVYREISDLVTWFFEEGDRPEFQVKLKDGFFDLWAPLVGAAIAELLKAL